MHKGKRNKVSTCVFFCIVLVSNCRGINGDIKCEGCQNDIRKDDRSSNEEDDSDDFGIEDHIRNIGTAGFIGIIVGAAAILAIVPLLYCFLCGWLCFKNKEVAKRKRIKDIKTRSSQVEFQTPNHDFVLRMDSPNRANIEDYLNRKLSYPHYDSRRSSNQFPHGYKGGIRHGSIISYISSRKQSGFSGYSNGSDGDGPMSIWSDSGEAINKEFSQPIDFSHVLYYYS